jgi:hypothetical protein
MVGRAYVICPYCEERNPSPINLEIYGGGSWHADVHKADTIVRLAGDEYKVKCKGCGKTFHFRWK